MNKEKDGNKKKGPGTCETQGGRNYFQKAGKK